MWRFHVNWSFVFLPNVISSLSRTHAFLKYAHHKHVNICLKSCFDISNTSPTAPQEKGLRDFLTLQWLCTRNMMQCETLHIVPLLADVLTAPQMYVTLREIHCPKVLKEQWVLSVREPPREVQLTASGLPSNTLTNLLFMCTFDRQRTQITRQPAIWQKFNGSVKIWDAWHYREHIANAPVMLKKCCIGIMCWPPALP